MRWMTSQNTVVSTLSRPKAAGLMRPKAYGLSLFQHSAARRRLFMQLSKRVDTCWFQHSAARRRLNGYAPDCIGRRVSTLSRPKAAAISPVSPWLTPRFNTQPPEGGWGCADGNGCFILVSTLSRPKAAGRDQTQKIQYIHVSTLSRPKAAEPLSKALLHQVSQPRFR